MKLLGNGKTVAVNRKTSYNYYVEESFDAGIMLSGCQIKSIRQGECNISDAFCIIDDGEVFVKGMYIKPYENAGFTKTDPYHDIKLLLTKHEIRKLQDWVKVKGNTIVPLTLYIDDRGYAKMRIAVVKGKKVYDKRETIKERDINREMDRMILI